MRRSNTRGFALITVILLIALATVSSLVMLDVIQTDRKIAGEERRAREARLAAEGGLMEVLNSRDILSRVPTTEDPQLSTTYTPPSSSRFHGSHVDYGNMQYNATIRLVRVAPMLESSHNRVRAVVYEVDVEAQLNNQVAAGVEAEIFTIASSRTGVIQPRMHAR